MPISKEADLFVCEVCREEARRTPRNVYIVHTDNGKQSVCKKCFEGIHKGSLTTCTICGEHSKIPLSNVYCGEEELRVCKPCRVMMVEGTRMLINGLRRNNELPGMIFRESKLESSTSFATMSAIPKRGMH